MNNGAFGENFPYSNFHDLNMDWIIKIAKDFLDQYTHIQEIIETGKTDITELTEEGLNNLKEKATELQSALQAWYDEHSADISDQLDDALSALETAVQTALNTAISTFNAQANHKGEVVIASIPADYTTLSNIVTRLSAYGVEQNKIENKYVNDEGVVANSEITDMVEITNPYKGMGIDYTGYAKWCFAWGYDANNNPHELVQLSEGKGFTHYKFTITEDYNVVRLWGAKGSYLPEGEPAFNVLIDGANFQASIPYRERNEVQAWDTQKRYLTRDGEIGWGDDTFHLLELKNVTNRCRIKYTGYARWTPIFAILEDNTKIKLFPQTDPNYWNNVIIEITDPRIKTIQAWTVTSWDGIDYDYSLCYTDDCPNQTEQEVLITVGRGNADFASIYDAIVYAKEKYDVAKTAVTIFVRKGVYNLSYVESRLDILDKGANKISIIGEDRDNTKIVLTNTDSQMNCMMSIGGDCRLANLSFYAYYNADGTTGEQRRNYCLHADYGYNYSYDTPYATVIENCYFYSEGMRPIGGGLWQNQTMIFKDCIIEWLGTRWSTSGGALDIHGPTDTNATRCAVQIINCSAENKSNGLAIALRDVENMLQFTNIPTLLQRNIAYSNGTPTNISAQTHKLAKTCALNNVASMNY